MKARLLLSSAILVIVPAFGHHDIAAEYDVTRTIRISGTISNVVVANPHVMISLDTGNADGTVTHWNVETGSTAALAQGGISRREFAQGSTIVIFGYPAKDGSPKVEGRVLRFANGKDFRMVPWERDLFNPLRDKSWPFCGEVEVQPGPIRCIPAE